jgi:hypothetical protein
MLAAPAKEVGMGWLDKLLGREEKAADQGTAYEPEGADKPQEPGSQTVEEVQEHVPEAREEPPADRPGTGSDAPGPPG